MRVDKMRSVPWSGELEVDMVEVERGWRAFGASRLGGGILSRARICKQKGAQVVLIICGRILTISSVVRSYIAPRVDFLSLI